MAKKPIKSRKLLTVPPEKRTRLDEGVKKQKPIPPPTKVIKEGVDPKKVIESKPEMIREGGNKIPIKFVNSMMFTCYETPFLRRLWCFITNPFTYIFFGIIRY